MSFNREYLKDKTGRETVAMYKRNRTLFDCYAHNRFLCPSCFQQAERDYYLDLLVEMEDGNRAPKTFFSVE